MRLSSILVEDFRSIRGTQRISLDAPAVLIHGPNGTGKTSLLSAIEFGLTGAVASLGRFDPAYLQYLPHKKSVGGRSRVVLEAEGLETTRAEVACDGTTVAGSGLLTPSSIQFFTERCYLPQAALGRLLEIYEHQDNRKSDSPLTRFVKELLGLEALDALIDGLNTSRNVTRLRGPAPTFWAARESAPAVAKRIKDAEMAATEGKAALAAIEKDLREKLDGIAPADTPLTNDGLAEALDGLDDEVEASLAELARRRRDLASATNQLAAAVAADAQDQRVATEAAAGAARVALERWQADFGRGLSALLSAVRGRFPKLADTASDPASVHADATQLVANEIQRLQSLQTSDASDGQAIASLEEAIRQGVSRVTNIDLELEQGRGADQELAQALTAISSHIDGEDCPVCGRDFREISEKPLASHISEEVQRLIKAASRIQGLLRDRSTTSASVAQAERQKDELAARRLSDDRRDVLKVDLAQFTEWRTSLTEFAEAASRGTNLQRQGANASGALSILNSRQSGVSGLRVELRRHAEELGRSVPPEDQPLQVLLDELTAFVAQQEAIAEGRKARLEEIEGLVEDLSDASEAVGEAVAELEQAKSDAALSAAELGEAEHRISVARNLAAAAQALRTEKVRQVFNDELNSVWRELFIRLAPEEEFVPAFALPGSTTGPVEAVLETIYRSGGKGGNPRAMLSAGNLNTAALTLFLALNLSVKPVLPWLIIDDPVQSMDDVHIAQFAALLRTLKAQGRQVILAVHDRQLFEYLALELSPAFNGDRLITIELGRTSEGMTTAPWELTAFEPDKAVAA
ncbi:MAG: AAA family ATPase [Phenylobacterium sp.]|uniref:AAA family ATPase n=1 Tax=Phenylobacterium sp. TaxID=1871053 RepID=UPI003BB6AD8D